MAARTPSIHVFHGRPLFLLSPGIHSIINFGSLSSCILLMWPYYWSLFLLSFPFLSFPFLSFPFLSFPFLWSIVPLVFFLCCHSIPSFFLFFFFPLLSWPCFIFHFSITLYALMALIPCLLHFFGMFPGSFASPLFDLFICFISLTSFLTVPFFFIICLYPLSPLPPLFIPFLFHPGGHFMLQQFNCLYFPRDPFTAFTIIVHPPFSSILDCMTLEDGADRPSRNVGYQPIINAKEERMPLLHRDGSPKFRVFFASVMSVQR